MRNSFKDVFLNPLVSITFSIGIIVSFILFFLISNTIQKSNDLEFQYYLKREAVSIQNELNLNLYALNALKIHYGGIKEVTRKEFKRFSSSILVNQNGIAALSWIPRITNENRVNYVKQRKTELGANFNIKEKSINGKMISAKIKDEYYPVDFIEPLRGNEKAQGFDLSSNATRLETLKEAVSKNTMVATSRIKLVQENKAAQYGFLVATPVWNNANNEILEGYFTGVFKISNIINTAMKSNELYSSMLDIWLMDTTKDEKELLFTNSKGEFIPGSSKTINVAEKTWTLYAKPSDKFIEEKTSYIPLLVLLFSLFLTFLIAYFISRKAIESIQLETILDSKTKDLVASNKKLESLLYMFDKKVIASRTNEKGIITYVTDAFSKVSGFSKEELIGQNHRIVKHPDMDVEIYRKLWETITSGNNFTGELKNKRKDGSFYWVDEIIFPEFDDKKIIGYFSIREDITAKKEVVNFNDTLSVKIEEAILENQKKDQLLLQQSKLAAMGEMIGAVAHQWRQPLNSLAIKLQFIEDDFEDGIIDEKYLNKYATESMELVNFMSKTIDDFRNFFNIDKIKTNFDVNKKIKDTLNILHAQLESHNVTIDISKNTFNVFGHANEFQQVILNIVNNSKDALVESNTENRKINIEITSTETNGVIKIIDNAGGIPANIISRIFEPYFTTKEPGKGTGIGLYMSKMIIEDNMNGKLEVQPSKDGVVFIIKLGVNNEK